MSARRGAIAAVFACLALTACGSGGDSSTSSPSTTPTTATPTPTPTTATPEQVASIIAGKENNWRAVIDGAGTCRIRWTVKQTNDPAEEANATSCYIREMTMGTTAQTAIRDLGELTIPPSMAELVEETKDSLQQVVNVDLEAICGPISTGPSDTTECDEALGERVWAYTVLTDALDSWGPYL